MPGILEMFLEFFVFSIISWTSGFGVDAVAYLFRTSRTALLHTSAVETACLFRTDWTHFSHRITCRHRHRSHDGCSLVHISFMSPFKTFVHDSIWFASVCLNVNVSTHPSTSRTHKNPRENYNLLTIYSHFLMVWIESHPLYQYKYFILQRVWMCLFVPKEVINHMWCNKTIDVLCWCVCVCECLWVHITITIEWSVAT